MPFSVARLLDGTGSFFSPRLKKSTTVDMHMLIRLENGGADGTSGSWINEMGMIPDVVDRSIRTIHASSSTEYHCNLFGYIQ